MGTISACNFKGTLWKLTKKRFFFYNERCVIYSDVTILGHLNLRACHHFLIKCIKKLIFKSFLKKQWLDLIIKITIFSSKNACCITAAIICSALNGLVFCCCDSWTKLHRKEFMNSRSVLFLTWSISDDYIQGWKLLKLIFVQAIRLVWMETYFVCHGHITTKNTSKLVNW